MGWTFEQLQRNDLTLSGASDICFDGRDVWVANGTQCHVFSYWDENSEYEYLDQNYYFTRNVVDLHLVQSLDTGAVRKLATWNEKMYLLKDLTIDVWDVPTRAFVETITLPQGVQPVICAGSNKLWVVTLAVDDVTDQQSLLSYDLISEEWTSRFIAGRKQFLNRDIVDGLDGFIYVTSFNDHAIVQFSAATGTAISTFRINRHPYKLHVNQNKDVWVISDAGMDPLEGMVSKFNQTTEVSTNFAAAGGRMASFWDDEVQDQLWYIGGVVKLGRLDKTTNDFRFTQGDALGYTISLDDYGIEPASIEYGIVTPQLTYEKWNGSSFDTVTVRPYLFFIGGNKLHAARLTAMVRVNSIEVLGTAIIATKAQNYYGDLT
jgi:hypothetical protein